MGGFMVKARYEVNVKKAVIWGLVVILLSMIIGNVLYMNPYVGGFYEQYEDHPAMKSPDEVGGLGNWLALMMGGGFIFDSILIVMFLRFHPRIPGSGWQKGLVFGLLYWSIRTLPEGLDQYLLFNYPAVLILIPIINGFIGSLLFCVLMAIIFEKVGVFKYYSDNQSSLAL
jgi:hypothetical protein